VGGDDETAGGHVIHEDLERTLVSSWLYLKMTIMMIVIAVMAVGVVGSMDMMCPCIAVLNALVRERIEVVLERMLCIAVDGNADVDVDVDEGVDGADGVAGVVLRKEDVVVAR
jgi:hypothetical protein